MSKGEREPFYKAEFCQAVTGLTDTELRDVVAREWVDPVDQAHQNFGGRDMPRTAEDRVVEKHVIFMSAQFRFPLLNIPRESLCDAFNRFRESEEYVHPRDQFPNHEAYYGQAYGEIDKACEAGDEKAVRIGIQSLIDKILHD